MLTNPSPSSQNVPEHQLEWNDRLQDWLDGDADPAESAVFEKHLHDCAICQQRLAQFEVLEDALFSGSPRPQLDAGFDARLFAQIDSHDETQRAAARQRVEQELQQNLRALSRSWRRALTFVIAGVIGGVALAFALTGHFDASGLTGRLAAEGASELGGNAGSIHVLLTAVMGAAIGGVMAGWLAKLAG